MPASDPSTTGSNRPELCWKTTGGRDAEGREYLEVPLDAIRVLSGLKPRFSEGDIAEPQQVAPRLLEALAAAGPNSSSMTARNAYLCSEAALQLIAAAKSAGYDVVLREDPRSAPQTEFMLPLDANAVRNGLFGGRLELRDDRGAVQTRIVDVRRPEADQGDVMIVQAETGGIRGVVLQDVRRQGVWAASGLLEEASPRATLAAAIGRFAGPTEDFGVPLTVEKSVTEAPAPEMDLQDGYSPSP